MKEIINNPLFLIILTWILKTLIDLGVKYSKNTENTLDDFIFNKLKEFLNLITNIKTKKK